MVLVCATCHGREGELFENSRMKAGMDQMGKPGCVACHSNHGIQHPTDAMLSTAQGGTCSGCHQPGGAPDKQTHAIIATFNGVKTSIHDADSLLKVADVRGMETAPGRESMKDAQDKLVALRAAIHSFDPKQVGGALGEASGAARKAADYGRRSLLDWRNRRVGMAVSLGVILVLIALLVARIRMMGAPGRPREMSGPAA